MHGTCADELRPGLSPPSTPVPSCLPWPGLPSESRCLSLMTMPVCCTRRLLRFRCLRSASSVPKNCSAPCLPYRDRVPEQRRRVRGPERLLVAQGALVDHLERAQEEEKQPERRRHVGHDPHQQVKAVGGPEAARGQEPCVLQVALAPAPVALGALDQRGRPLLVASL